MKWRQLLSFTPVGFSSVHLGVQPGVTEPSRAWTLPPGGSDGSSRDSFRDSRALPAVRRDKQCGILAGFWPSGRPGTCVLCLNARLAAQAAEACSARPGAAAGGGQWPPGDRGGLPLWAGGRPPRFAAHAAMFCTVGGPSGALRGWRQALALLDELEETASLKYSRLPLRVRPVGAAAGWPELDCEAYFITEPEAVACGLPAAGPSSENQKQSAKQQDRQLARLPASKAIPIAAS